MPHDLEQIRREFMQFAPHYAREEADAALDRILALQDEGVVRSGLYYPVLVDIVASTQYLAEYGNVTAAARIQFFVTSAIAAISETDITNNAIFIKELGDAVLLLFQCFPDVIRWHDRFEERLASFMPDQPEHKFRIRTCVHVGDVILQGVNPVALAVSQLFKFEKDVEENEIVLSEPAYQAAWPTLARAYHAFEAMGDVELPGYPEPVGLYRLRRETVLKVGEFVLEESTVENS